MTAIRDFTITRFAFPRGRAIGAKTARERDYIEAVRAYNTALRTFPTVLWAKTAFSGNKPMAEFTASEGSEKPPQVKF